MFKYCGKEILLWMYLFTHKFVLAFSTRFRFISGHISKFKR